MGQTVKMLLFRKWDTSEIQIQDVGLKNAISLKQIIMPLSSGRSALKRFNKAEVNIVERLTNKLMIRPADRRSDPGGQRRPDAGGQAVRHRAPGAVLDLCDLVDPGVDP